MPTYTTVGVMSQFCQHGLQLIDCPLNTDEPDGIKLLFWMKLHTESLINGRTPNYGVFFFSNPRLVTYKAVVAGPAGPASAGPLFWPNMLSAVSLFCRFSRSCRACDLIPSKVPRFID